MKIALLGIGTVGRSFKNIIDNHHEYDIKYVLVRKTKGLDNECFKIEDILNDDEVEVVVELMGGIHPAYEYIKASLLAHKNVISANKDLIALYLDEFLKIAKDNHVYFNFEAACGGGIPLIKEILEYQQLNHINSFKAILNGTCNYILDKMTKDNLDFIEALKRAQDLGYAEKDPTSDIKAYDTKYKLAIIAMLISHKKLDLDMIDILGIDKISYLDIKYFKDKVIKLIAYFDYDNAFVIPMVCDDIFKDINDNLNCFKYNSDNLNDLYLIGQGAGGKATASAVFRDLVKPINIDILDDNYLDIKNNYQARFYLRALKEMDIDRNIINEISFDDKYQYIITNKIEVREIIRKYKDKECFIALMD